MDLMRQAYCFVGNDCGPAHLAAALNIPQVVFFGPTFRGRTGPWHLGDKKNRFIQSLVPCGPCHMTKQFYSCNNPICHGEVTLDDFIREFGEIHACAMS